MTTTEYLQREIRRTELSIRRAKRKPNAPPEELRGLNEKLEHLQEALEAVNEHWQRVHEQRGWTVHIDREKWEPCEHCKPSKKNALDRWGPHQFPIDDGAIYYHDVDDGWEGEEINFCPWCGRPLTDEAWDELERRVCGG